MTQRFQRGCSSFAPVSVRAVEIEVFFHEVRGKRGREGAQQVPAQIDLPIGKRHGFQLLVQRLEKLRLADVHAMNVGEIRSSRK